MINVSFLIACLVCSGSAQMPSTTDWRGLSPIVSTRKDVERTLGRPYRTFDNRQMTYRFPDVEVFLYFTTNPKCQEKLPYTSWDVTVDTVTAIEVSFSRPPLVSDIGIDLTKFRKIEGDFDLIDRYHYVNDDNSFGIEVDGKYVAGYKYVPGSKHKNLRCERTK